MSAPRRAGAGLQPVDLLEDIGRKAADLVKLFHVEIQALRRLAAVVAARIYRFRGTVECVARLRIRPSRVGEHLLRQQAVWRQAVSPAPSPSAVASPRLMRASPCKSVAAVVSSAARSRVPPIQAAVDGRTFLLNCGAWTPTGHDRSALDDLRACRPARRPRACGACGGLPASRQGRPDPGWLHGAAARASPASPPR